MNLIPTAGADCRPTSFPPVFTAAHDPQPQRVRPSDKTTFVGLLLRKPIVSRLSSDLLKLNTLRDIVKELRL